MGILKDILTSGTASLVKSITEGLDSLITNKAERLALQMQIEKQVQDYTIRMTELTQQAEDSLYKDIQSARAMQQVALQQQDLFSKRYVYYLSTALILVAVAFDFTLFFVNIPVENRDMINMALGTLNSLGFASVVTFFLGSSRSSAQKTDTINTLVNKQ